MQVSMQHVGQSTIHVVLVQLIVEQLRALVGPTQVFVEVVA